VSQEIKRKIQIERAQQEERKKDLNKQRKNILSVSSRFVKHHAKGFNAAMSFNRFIYIRIYIHFGPAKATF
jgi:hypothetical protein